MKIVLKIIAIWFVFTSFGWATDMPLLPMGGTYIVKDNRIVTIAGKTMVIGDETRLVNCGGKAVSRLPSGIKVTYTLKQPVEGPIPVLATVNEVCG